MCTVGQVVHTLPSGLPVIGVTSLDNEIYVLRPKECDQVEVYDIMTYLFMRCLTVPNGRGFTDMTSCEHFRCLYVSNHIDDCVHRLGLDGGATQWDVDDKLACLSVNKLHNVLVTCPFVRMIKEFSSHGDLLREIKLPRDIIRPWHAIQLNSGEFIVCHGIIYDADHRVCKIRVDGRYIVHSHGGQRGSDVGQYDGPWHLAVDNNEFAFVADLHNRRVKLLSPTLNYVREVVSRDKLKWRPKRLHLDAGRQRLYVADNEWKHNVLKSGRVVVFSV